MKEIKLSNKHKSSKNKGIYSAIVDDEDYELLSKFNWSAVCVRSLVYACRVKDGKMVLMHREIACPKDGFVVDHIDSNGLNNQKANMRCIKQENNLRNARKCNRITSSKYKGVSYSKVGNGRWKMSIGSGKNRKYKSFNTELEAAAAYDNMAKQMFGEYAHLNFK